MDVDTDTVGAFSVTFSMTLDDSAAATVFLYHRSIIEQRSFVRLLIFVGSLSATLLCLLLADALTARTAAMAFVVTGIFILVYTQAMWPSAARSTRRQLASLTKGAPADSRRTVSLTDTGVYIEYPLGNSFTLWAGINRPVITDRHFMLFTGTRTAIVVPRRAFPMQETFMTFCNEARRRVDLEIDSQSPPTGGFPVSM